MIVIELGDWPKYCIVGGWHMCFNTQKQQVVCNGSDEITEYLLGELDTLSPPLLLGPPLGPRVTLLCS